jgi:hypothetical protein
MVSTTLRRESPLSCPSCGPSEISLVYAAPVRVLVRKREVVSVRVDDEQALFSGSALCTCCGRRWRLAEESEMGFWPAWEFGP